MFQFNLLVIFIFQVLNETNDHRKRVIAGVTTELQKWFISTCKAKAIYHTLNCFSVDITNKCLIGEGWVPVIELNTVRKALSDGAVSRYIYSFIVLQLLKIVFKF